ncbi:hypothetical protein TA3x_001905 [Tundrisphaera sp. TA3]|uniref:hypothetical protein n=1 Tax=Tundrisphaera sp. TA3 TaxID=3435775 RepID=UPI003EBD2C2C
MSTRHPGKSRRRPARLPQLEGLEDRLCLTSSVELFGDGTLFISGDNGRDAFEIADGGQGTVGVIGNFDVFGDGAYGDSFGTYDALFDGVSRIVVETYGGNDFVEYYLTDPLLVPRAVSLDLGGGNDRAVVTLGTVQGVDLFVDVDLGRGNDRFDGSLSGDLLDASIQFDVDGSAGNDDIGVVADDLYLDDFSLLDMVLFGGAGNDLVTADLEFAPSSTGRVVVSVLGAGGNDSLGLNVYGVENVADGSSAYLDGGPGRDRFGATPEVSVVNVEPTRGRRR